MTPTCHVVNLQTGLGGAEVYTMFFARAVRAAGCRTVLHVHPQAEFWRHLGQRAIEIAPVTADVDLLHGLQRGAWLVTHAPISREFAATAKVHHWLTGFCHMPLTGRTAGALADYDQVYAVSAHVLSTLAPMGVTNAYPEPLYGIAEFERGAAGPCAEGSVIRRRLAYSWDRRKFRDRVLAMCAPAVAALLPHPEFRRRPGVTLGIVSYIGPIKQFDTLFCLIAPHLARRPQVNLEIFGDGGYRSVRDLKHALAPLGGRARFWGMQPAPQAIYPQLDFLLSGLPEKEALGLNIIEAQMCGTPVLAVDAPPFTETVADCATGYLYPDPRQDAGSGFARVLDHAMAAPRLTPLDATAHLERFSRLAFDARVTRLVAHAMAAKAEHG